MQQFIIIGVGGVGGLMGGLLAKAGFDVTFVARGATAQAMRQHGLRIKSILGDFTIAQPDIVENAAQLSGDGCALVSVKGYQLEKIAGDLKQAKNYHGCILPLLNGVDAPEVLSNHIGSARVLGGYCRIISEIESPGVIKHWAVEPAITFGEINGQKSDRARAIADALNKSGIKATTSDNIMAGMWEKLAGIASYGTPCAAARATLGEVCASEFGKELIKNMAREILSTGRAAGVQFPPDIEEKIAAFVFKLPPETTSSLQRDMAAGKQSELEWQLGSVVHRARQLGAPTPCLDAVYALLWPWEQKNRQIAKAA